MYLAKHRSLDIANTVRELARHYHNPMEAHWDGIYDCICYVKVTLSRGLVLKPTGRCVGNGKDNNFKFKICSRSDSNYATDPDSRRSIADSVLYLNNTSIVFSCVTTLQTSC